METKRELYWETLLLGSEELVSDVKSIINVQEEIKYHIHILEMSC